MTPKIHTADLPTFDMAQQLKSKEDIAAYVTMVIEDGDAAELAHALDILADEARWDEQFAATEDLMKSMADRVRASIRNLKNI